MYEKVCFTCKRKIIYHFSFEGKDYCSWQCYSRRPLPPREHTALSDQTTPVVPEKKGDINEKVYLFYEQRPYEPKL